jgi:transcriptional regulator GlxA family with amidase domain
MANDPPIEIAFVVLPEVNMMALTSAIEPMRVANMLSGSELYRWRLYSLDGKSVRASNNIVLEVDGSIHDRQGFEIVFVCASWRPEAYDDPKFFAWLREADRKGKRIGAIDTGAIVLARAQLLEGYRATANYDVIDGFSESHPGVQVTDHLFEIDRNRTSCSAGTAPLDMMLNLVAERFGPNFTVRVASHLFHNKIREPAESQVQAVRHHGTDIAKEVRDAIDREALLQSVLRGHGVLGNDHPIGRSNRFHAGDLEQRPYDPERAKFHLKNAGLSNLKVDLSAADAAFAGAVDAAVLYKEHAAKAGIEINVVREPNDGYWSNVWLKKPWCAVYWAGRPTEDLMLSTAYAAGAPWNDSYWENERFNQLLVAARAELDEAKRRDMYGEMQRLIRDEGGVVVPMFANNVFAMSKRVQHEESMGADRALDGTRGMERWWFA